jgi:hypothetical protein
MLLIPRQLTLGEKFIAKGGLIQQTGDRGFPIYMFL